MKLDMKEKPLENLKLLKKDMEEKDWTICSFIFTYKKVEYIVLVKRFIKKEPKKNKYALVKLHFIKSDNLSHEMKCEANSNGLIIDAKNLREYFKLEYSINLGDILKQFTKYFGDSIPKIIKENYTLLEKELMVKSLSLSDREDPKKIYCTHLKRNPKGQFRSGYNSDKTKLLRKNLFEYFKDDKTISFCYSTEEKNEKTDKEILNLSTTV